MKSGMRSANRPVGRRAGLPEGFVYIDRFIPDCVVDVKYAGSDNFMGRPVAGYERPFVVASLPLALACAKAAALLRPYGYVLKIYDAYRPQRAVDDFCRWMQDAGNDARKPLHYPNINKAEMLKRGYIAGRSGHTRACAVDLTLVEAQTMEELDMGCIFDFMDERSHHGAPGLTPAQEANRALLKNAMLVAGLTPLKEEWWHYSLRPEPYPETYFDFPIA